MSLNGKRISRRSLLKGSAAVAATGVAATAVASCSTESTNTDSSQIVTGQVSKAPFDISDLNMLDDKQMGHIRHIRNVGARQGGDWKHMDANDPIQFGFSSYRYPLAHMAYTLAAAHYHHLPAAPGAFKGPYEQIIEKMLRQDVWGYWKETSASGVKFNPDIKELRPTWADPVVRENIMYSGHLLAMVGFHSMLFGDGTFDKPGSISFEYESPLGGLTGKPDIYAYNFTSLTEVIYNQFVESNWLGIPCEPNCVFFICNQFPIIGMKYHDQKHGTNFAEKTTAGYSAAWTARGDQGWIGKDGMFNSMYMIEQDQVHADTYFTPWMHPYMNTWNGPMMRELYPQQSAGLLQHLSDGTAYPKPFEIFQKERLASSAGGAHTGHDTIGSNDLPIEGNQRYGLVAMWLAEMGDPDLSKVLDYADSRLNPQWDNGGLYYPRNDKVFNDAGDYTYMESFTGNALLGQARLNMDDGYRTMYQKPWTATHMAQPNVAELSADVELSRAEFLPEKKALLWTARGLDQRRQDAYFVIANAEHSPNWTLSLGNETVLEGRVGENASKGNTNAEWKNGQLQIQLPVDSPVNVTVEWT